MTIPEPQRWSAYGSGYMVEEERGRYVTYADARAWVDASVADALAGVHQCDHEGIERAIDYARREGRADALREARAAALPHLARLTRHACTAYNWEQTDSLIRHSVGYLRADLQRLMDKAVSE